MSPHEFFQVIPLGHVVDFPQLLNSAYVTGRLATLPEPQVHLGHVDDVHICLFSCINLGKSQRYEGDACTIDGLSGSCKLLKNCAPAIVGLRNGKYPQMCGFSNLDPVVCCVSEGSAIITTTQSTTSNNNQRSLERNDRTSTESSLIDSNNRSNNDPDTKVGSKARAMCEEYSKYVYEWITPPVQTINFGKVKVNRCAHKVTELVIGGQHAGVREFPHMALLGMGEENSKKWTCGGTLISDEFVLTAGHCVFSPQDGEVRWIRLGENDISNEGDSETQDFSVAEIIKHPQYKAPSRYHDIALLRLDRKAILNKFVIPACLHTEFNINHQKAIATGWGRTEYLGSTSQQLFKVTLEMFSQEECNETYSAFASSRRLRSGIVPESQMCAGHHSEMKDTCQGDSGGPLQTYLEVPYCMYDLIGVTSFGITCGVVGSPGVYTRVSEYLPWIEQIVWG
ncbi:serine protease snake-like [Ctenocephalides felis]|uniref:serine protease snake-like n=1 Tax=Ctenocephalides felis TaxID=7515 RepID=UPI000E6E385D|nr:serine protease snake-like [Ctenocephalides felis]